MSATCRECGVPLAFNVPGALCWNCHPGQKIEALRREAETERRLERQKAAADREVRRRKR